MRADALCLRSKHANWPTNPYQGISNKTGACKRRMHQHSCLDATTVLSINAFVQVVNSCYDLVSNYESRSSIRLDSSNTSLLKHDLASNYASRAQIRLDRANWILENTCLHTLHTQRTCIRAIQYMYIRGTSVFKPTPP